MMCMHSQNKLVMRALEYVPRLLFWLQDRLQRYQKKVAKAADEADLAAAKRTLTLDVATANRFINAAITDLPSEQREALRRVCLHAYLSIQCTTSCRLWHITSGEVCFIGAGARQKEMVSGGNTVKAVISHRAGRCSH